MYTPDFSLCSTFSLVCNSWQDRHYGWDYQYNPKIKVHRSVTSTPFRKAISISPTVMMTELALGYKNFSEIFQFITTDTDQQLISISNEKICLERFIHHPDLWGWLGGKIQWLTKSNVSDSCKKSLDVASLLLDIPTKSR